MVRPGGAAAGTRQRPRRAHLGSTVRTSLQGHVRPCIHDSCPIVPPTFTRPNGLSRAAESAREVELSCSLESETDGPRPVALPDRHVIPRGLRPRRSATMAVRPPGSGASLSCGFRSMSPRPTVPMTFSGQTAYAARLSSSTTYSCFTEPRVRYWLLLRIRIIVSQRDTYCLGTGE
jgi:hypothetical protein